MAYFAQYSLKRVFFAYEFRFQKRPPAVDLIWQDSRSCLPREGQPRKKGRTFTLCSPLFALQSIGQRGAAACGDGKDTAVRAGRRLFASAGTNQAELLELLDRVIHLGTRDAGPVAHLAALQFQIGLIAVHGLFRQQAQQDKVRSGQRRILLTRSHVAPSVSGSNTTTHIVPRASAGQAPALPLR